MKQTIHACLNVRGLLELPKSKLKHLFHDNKGARLSPDEAKNYLYNCLSEGKEVLPFGEPCEGFDYKKGCNGHKQDKEE
jgi:hypothetical protein